MTTLRPYPVYKPSGIDWLGEIPTQWEARRIKHVALLNPSKANTNGLQDSDPVTFVPMERLGTDGSIDTSESRPLGEVKSGLTYFGQGDVILAKITPCFENGKSAVASELPGGLAFGSTEYHVMRPARSLDAHYLYRVISSKPFLLIGEENMEGSAGQKRIPTDFVANFTVPIPPLDEQHAIADFLDAMDARFDRFIAARRRMIALLEEQKQAIINQAVTKGLDPDVPMKPSGIEWLGDIPAHWDVARVKHVAKLESGHTPSRTDDEHWLPTNDIPWVSLNDTKSLSRNDYISATTHYINALGLQNSSARLLPERVVVFTRDATIGKAAITTRPMAVSQHLIAWVCGPLIHPEYLLHVFYAMEHELDAFTFGATIKTIGMDDVRKLVTPVPPLVEQLQLVETLLRERLRIDSLIATQRRQIELIQEYRTRLISDVVTGKLNVRGAVSN